MAEDGPYRSWMGISQAIKSEAGRAAKSGETGLTVAEQIVQANHDRFLSRVFADGEASEWLLKGGTAMLARVPSSRATQDLDLAAVSARDLDAAQDALERIASRDLGDHVTFQLTSTRETGRGENQPGVLTRRLVFAAHDADTGRKLFDVPIDVAVGPAPVGTVEVSEPGNRMRLGRPIETHPYRLFPIADQIAEKVTATMSLYNGQPSSRVKDLVDLVTIGHTQSVRLRELQQAIDAKRALSRLEEIQEFTVPESWSRSYRVLAARTPSVQGLIEISEAVSFTKSLIDPALEPSPAGAEQVWVPGRGWTEDGEAPPPDPAPAPGGGDVHVRAHTRDGFPVVEHFRGARGARQEER